MSKSPFTRKSHFLGLLRRDEEQPLDLASRVAQRLVDVSEIGFARCSGGGCPPEVPRIPCGRPALSECQLPRRIRHRRSIREDLAHGSSDDVGAAMLHHALPHLVNESKDMLWADRDRYQKGRVLVSVELALVRRRKARLARAGHVRSDEARAIRNTEDRHELGYVRRDGALGDVQPTRDVARAVPAAKQIHDLDLPRRKGVTRASPP